jgi:hypothetical protein
MSKNVKEFPTVISLNTVTQKAIYFVHILPIYIFFYGSQSISLMSSVRCSDPTNFKIFLNYYKREWHVWNYGVFFFTDNS